jgi:putative transcriptional regulator
MKHAFVSLKDHFLIAMPALTEGIFAHSVTYLCEHNEEGALGIVINQPLGLRLSEVLQHLDIEDIDLDRDEPVLAGGPVQTDRGFVLHTPSGRGWDSTVQITEQISLTTSRDVLAAIAHHEGPAACLVALGYAGWGAGQLESELGANAWLTLPADSAIIFHTPIEQRLNAAAAKLGVDLVLMAPGAGHA